ncbi:APC amino acid permease [Syncephalis plumigaleata]|nr:APC amino acid permease [Syncephalis plumigaleata]
MDVIDESERRLRELGYRQASTTTIITELKRELTSFNNFSVSFSIVSILTGLSSMYGFGLTTGGPAMVIWGWCIVVICSAYPTSGGLYFWSARLASPRWAPFVSWITGWFNLLGQISCTAAIDFGLALTLSSTISIATDFTYTETPGSVVGIYLCILVILVCAEHLQPASWVFGHFENRTGWDNNGYAALISLLMAQYTLSGYDASANMTEETKRADIAGPVGIVMAVVVSFFIGLFYLIGLNFAIQDYDRLINSQTGMAIAQLFLDTMGRTGAVLLLVILLGAMFFAGNASMTSNSRTIYAFSRDKAVPGYQWWHKIDERWHSPAYAVWFSATIAGLLGLLHLGNSTAFTAITSLTAIGLYISYGLPILCRVCRPSAFERGPLHLGRAGYPIGVVAFSAKNMNYAIAVTGVVVIGVGGWWLISARHWFTGPSFGVSTDSETSTSTKEGTPPPLQRLRLIILHYMTYNTFISSF